MAKSDRKVVNDISKANFIAPSAGGGTNLPGLRTRNPSNNALEGLAGFSKTIAQLGLIREKNDAAAEALKAKNDALAGKYSSFKYKYSVDLYDQTRGDIKGRSSSLAIQEQLQALNTDILNQNKDIDTSLEMFNEGSAKIFQDNYGDHLNQSEAYKSGFLPHVVNGREKNRTALAEAHKAKFDVERQGDLQELTNILIDEVTPVHVFDPENPDSGGKLAGKLTYDENSFKENIKAGVQLGLTKETALDVTVTTLISRSIADGTPELLALKDVRLDNGVKLFSHPKYGPLLLDAEVKARSAYITKEKRIIEREKQELTAKRDAMGADSMQYLIENAGGDNREYLQSVADMKILKPSTMASLITFDQNLASNDYDIHVDDALVTDTYAAIANGFITTTDQLKTLYNNSKEAGRGLNTKEFLKLNTYLQSEINEAEETANAFTAFRKTISGVIPEDDTALFGLLGQMRPDGGVYTYDDILNSKRVRTKMLAQYDSSAQAFQRLHPGKSKSSPEAFDFYEKTAQALIETSQFDPTTPNNPEGFTPDDEKAMSARPVVIADLPAWTRDASKVELYSNWIHEVELERIVDADAEKHLNRVGIRLNGK